MDNSSEVNMQRESRNPGTWFAAAGILAMLSITSAQAVYPNFSTRNDAISYLGGAGVVTELFWNLCVIVVGIIWLSGTYVLYRRERNRFMTVLLLLAGIGFLLVGTSPWNVFPVTHGIGANMVFFFGAVSCLSASRKFTGPFSVISIIMGSMSLAAYISGYFGSYNILGPGGVERMIYYPILLWAIGFGGHLMYKYQNDSKTGT